MLNLSFLETEDFEIEDLEVSPGKVRITKGEGRLENLKPAEFIIFQTLALNPGRVYSVETLSEEIYGHEKPADVDNSVRQAIHRLRKKLRQVSEEDYIQTVTCFGYRFRDQP